MTAVPWADVEMHTMMSSQADGCSEQSRQWQVTMVGHSTPEQSACHLPEQLGETCWLFMGLVMVKGGN